MRKYSNHRTVICNIMLIQTKKTDRILVYQRSVSPGLISCFLGSSSVYIIFLINRYACVVVLHHRILKRVGEGAKVEVGRDTKEAVTRLLFLLCFGTFHTPNSINFWVLSNNIFWRTEETDST